MNKIASCWLELRSHQLSGSRVSALLLKRVICNLCPNRWNLKNLRSSFSHEFPPPQVQKPCWFSLPPQRPFCIYTWDARRMKLITENGWKKRGAPEPQGWHEKACVKLHSFSFCCKSFQPLSVFDPWIYSRGKSLMRRSRELEGLSRLWRATKLPLGCNHRRRQLLGNTAAWFCHSQVWRKWLCGWVKTAVEDLGTFVICSCWTCQTQRTPGWEIWRDSNWTSLTDGWWPWLIGADLCLVLILSLVLSTTDKES